MDNSIFYTKKCVQTQTFCVALIDLILGNIALGLGRNSIEAPDSDLAKWDLLSYNVHLGKGKTLELISTIVIFIGYFLEICLFILLSNGIRNLHADKLRLWCHVRFILLILASTIIISHVIHLRGTVETFIAQFLMGLILLLYKAYSIIIVNLLEEQINGSPSIGGIIA